VYSLIVSLFSLWFDTVPLRIHIHTSLYLSTKPDKMLNYAILGLAAAHGAQAWGVVGHATVAYIAQHYVTSEVESWAKGILGDTSDSYMANIASWADDYRETAAGKWSAPLHFIDAEDNPPSNCNVDYSRDCGSSGCSISAMANYTQRVGDGRLSAANTQEALKFLIHFTGDLTQPLHDEAYEVGGNDIEVTYQGYKDNLHAGKCFRKWGFGDLVWTKWRL
jgi:hypothetical protein